MCFGYWRLSWVLYSCLEQKLFFLNYLSRNTSEKIYMERNIKFILYFYCSDDTYYRPVFLKYKNVTPKLRSTNFRN